jgi:predicted transposase YbfD/YdcC
LLRELLENEFSHQEKRHPELIYHYSTDPQKGHGRIETRSISVLAVKPEQFHFPHIRQIGRLIRARESVATGKKVTEEVWLITNHSFETLSPREFLDYNRAHWHIENRLHYVLDDTFGEDRSTIRVGAGPKVMSVLRTLAVSLLRLGGVSNIKRCVEHLRRTPEQVCRMVACLN